MKILKKLLVSFSAMLVSIGAFSQNIDLSFTNAPLADVLQAIEMQTEYSFMYETSDLKSAPAVTVNVTDKTLSSVLDAIIKAPLSYEMKGTIVIITLTKQPQSAQQPAKNIRVSGTVVDAQYHEPMVGLMVMIKGTTVGTTTDLDGHFSITVPDRESVLVFDFIGYKQEQLTVGSHTQINVVMHQAMSELEESVVVGYGTQKRLTVVGAIDGVAPKQLQKGSTRSLSNNLAGQLAGVTHPE